MKTPTTLNEAFTTAKADFPVGHAWFSSDERARWNAAKKILAAAKLCPHCACDGKRSKLGPWEPGNQENHAGRECFECGEFVVCGEQPATNEPDLEPAFSDADPGL